MKMTDVALVCPLRYNSSRRNYRISYLILASYLERNGISTEIVDIKGEINKFHSVLSYEELYLKNKEIIKELQILNPLVVGVGCVSAETKDVISLCKQIKQTMKEAIIVVGGPHPTVLPEDFLTGENIVNFVIVGEGEITFTNLVKAIKEKKDTSQLKGLAYFKDGRIIETDKECYLTNINITPSYEKIDMWHYTRPSPDFIAPIYLSAAAVMTSRGCPARCTFCASYNLLKRTGIEASHCFRQRDMNEVVNEIEFLKYKYKIDAFSIVDDTFLTRKEYVINFCKELKKRNVDLLWGCSSRVNQVDENVLKEMRDAGCIQVCFGVESGNQKMLNTLKKGTTIDQIKKAFDSCKKMGIRTYAMLMFNLPNETVEDVSETVNLLREIKPKNVGFSILIPLPGTEIYEKLGIKLPVEECDKYGTGFDTLVDERFRFAKHNLDLDKLTQKYLDEFNPLRNRISFYFDKRYIRAILKSKRKLDYLWGLNILSKKLFWRVFG